MPYVFYDTVSGNSTGERTKIIFNVQVYGGEDTHVCKGEYGPSSAQQNP